MLCGSSMCYWSPYSFYISRATTVSYEWRNTLSTSQVTIYCLPVTLADNNGVVKESVEEPAESPADDQKNHGSYENDEDVSEDSPLTDEDNEEDNPDDEARELDHSKLGDSLNDETSNNGNTGSDKELTEGEQRQEDSDSEEGTIEVIFDSGGVKVTKKINIMPGLQLMLKEESEEEEEEMEDIDAEIEEENTITLEEGDGKWFY